MGSKKKKSLIIILVGILLILGLSIYFIKFDLKNSNTLNLEENKWIDENKYDVIDIAVLNDIPILSYEGEGLVYNYIDYVTKNHSLKFNIVPYKLDLTLEYDYQMSIVDKVGKNDIELLKDNLILITLDNKQYIDVNEINNLRIGVLGSDKKNIEEYLNNDTITYVEYNTYSDLKNSVVSAKTLKENGDTAYAVDAVILSKIISIKEVVENNLNVAYHFNDLYKHFVIRVNGNDKLNNIIRKTFNSWKILNYDEQYNEQFLSEYYKFKKMSDVEQKTLKSKNYIYGFINYGIYNYLDGNNISGLNGILLKEFNKFSGLSITYTQYNSISKLMKDFNSGKVDFSFYVFSKNDLKNDVYNTINVYDKKLVVISDINSNVVIDNIKSLKGKEILTIKNSYIEDYLTDNNIKFRSYNNLEALVSDFKTGDISIIDMENYNFYKTSYLKNSRINYIIDMADNYNFVVNDKEENRLFEDLFNFYLSFNSINKLTTVNYENIAYQNINITYILIIIIIILVLYVVLDFYNHMKSMMKTVKQSKKIKLTKEEKIMYIDQLTSLKNRAYLNSRIETWDDSEIYPQSIIVIDLNNISYVNDNYGREEGDKVITEAANILIQHQLANSEIIRTDGNEFLIYLVGYTEKQVISYLRKLSKEFKGLSHGFGAASGYSIITDAIKTIDDAVNEATLAMKENKEDIEY